MSEQALKRPLLPPGTDVNALELLGIGNCA